MKGLDSSIGSSISLYHSSIDIKLSWSSFAHLSHQGQIQPTEIFVAGAPQLIQILLLNSSYLI